MSAQEDLKSRFGSVGEGGTSFFRRFQVVKPSDAANDWTPTADTELLTKARLGTEMPELKGAFCRRYVLFDSMGTSDFIVDAIYEAPTALDPGFGGAWHVRIAGSLDVQYTEIVRPTEEEEAADPPLRPYLVGPLDYKAVILADDPIPATAEFYTLGGPGGRRLYTPGPRETTRRLIEGMDFYPPAMTLTCTKKFPKTEALRTMKIASHHGGVNWDAVNLLEKAWFTRGQLMLSDFEINDVPGTDQNEPVAQDVSITFAARLDGWQHTVVHTYRDESKLATVAEIVWYENGHPHGVVEPVIEDLRRQPWRKFSGFLGGL